MSLADWLWGLAVWAALSLATGSLLATAGYRRNNHRTRKEEL